MDDCCRLVLPYNAVHSIQQTEQIPNDPPQMGAKSTTTSNHPSTPAARDAGDATGDATRDAQGMQPGMLYASFASKQGCAHLNIGMRSFK